MAPKLSLKVQKKLSAIVRPQLDVLFEVRQDLCSLLPCSVRMEHKQQTYASLRKLTKCVQQLRESVTPKLKKAKKEDGKKKHVYLKNWFMARDKVNSEIAGSNVVKRLEKGSLYYHMVKAKHSTIE